MVPNKSLDEVEIIAALLCDLQQSHDVVINTRALKNTCKKVRKRVDSEGLGFLTKTLPRLGKAFQKALSGDTPLNGTSIGFETIPGTGLPRFLGELFSRVLQPNGVLLSDPCAQSVGAILDVTFLFYKYELPYSTDQEQHVISQFERTEYDLSRTDSSLLALREGLTSCIQTRRSHPSKTETKTTVEVAREAKIVLSNLFAYFDPSNISPRHGPGAVATKQKLWGKFQWTNVCSRITDKYPLDAYFYASLGHVCDRVDTLASIDTQDLPARVVLVPKESRGPRLISCEPVDFQWIQQGLAKAIVELVESHETTKFNVNFTHQEPNQRGALLGSSTGRYATLDLNEASDRVSLELVRLLFPPHICEYLEACRSQSTELPDGRILKLRKFAPMGSSLCFPILALSVWAILTAGAPDENTREGILVYGDDVIVPTAYAEKAMEHLESFGLKINRDKSCTKGLFRESCGTDAFKGVKVTPMRIRTVWSSTPSPDVYSSWIAYANQLWDRRYRRAYDYIVTRLVAVYGPIPGDDMHLACPSLRWVSVLDEPKHSRTNRHLQKRQYRVWDVKAPKLQKEIDGWSMLLRYFSETCSSSQSPPVRYIDSAWAQKTGLFQSDIINTGDSQLSERTPFSVRSYTRRGTSMLVRRWR